MKILLTLVTVLGTIAPAWSAPVLFGDDVLTCVEQVAGIPEYALSLPSSIPGQLQGSRSLIVASTRTGVPGTKGRSGLYVFPAGMPTDRAYFVTLPNRPVAVFPTPQEKQAFVGFQLGATLLGPQPQNPDSPANLFSVEYSNDIARRNRPTPGLAPAADLAVYVLDTLDRGKDAPFLLSALDTSARAEIAALIADGLETYRPILDAVDLGHFDPGLLAKARASLPRQKAALDSCLRAANSTRVRQAVETVRAKIYRQELLLQGA